MMLYTILPFFMSFNTSLISLLQSHELVEKYLVGRTDF